MSGKAVAALARIEALRLLRHPVILTALLVLGPLVYWATADPDWRYPVLHDADQWTQPPALVLGAAALLAGNLAVTRAHRGGAAAVLEGLVLRPAERTAAHLLALLPLAAITAVLVTGHIVLLASLGGAVSSPNLFELATGPVVVLLCGAIGVLLGRIVRSAVVAPLLTVVFAAVAVVLLGGPPSSADPNWFLPIAPASGGDPLLVPPSVPADLMTRVPAAHLVYLLGLLGLAASLALLISHRRPRAGGVIAVGLAIAITVTGGLAQVQPRSGTIDADRAAATRQPSAIEHCQMVGRVSYCAFAGFDPWIKDWAEVTEAILRRVPPDVAARPPAVRQRVYADGYPDQSRLTRPGDAPLEPPVADWRADDEAAGTPGAITVGTRWGDGWSETGFSGRLAHDLINPSGPGVSAELCGAQGVLIGWLAGQATAGTRAGLRTIADNSREGIAFLEFGFPAAITLDQSATDLVWTLLDRPDDEVGRQVLASWGELSAPGTTVERAAQLFGVPAPTAAGDPGRCR